jgi:hypothetical protein
VRPGLSVQAGSVARVGVSSTQRCLEDPRSWNRSQVARPGDQVSVVACLMRFCPANRHGLLGGRQTQEGAPDTPTLAASPFSQKAAVSKGETQEDPSTLDTQPSPLWRNHLLRFLRTAAGTSSTASTPAVGGRASGQDQGSKDSSHEGEDTYDYPMVRLLLNDSICCTLSKWQHGIMPRLLQIMSETCMCIMHRGSWSTWIPGQQLSIGCTALRLSPCT